jgi:putative phosphoribosyl transferase
MFERPFRDRTHAGRELAKQLRKYRHTHPLVIGLPRGGVPVAFEVARELGAELDVWIVRKVGAPMQPELGLGAVVEGGEPFIDRDLVAEVGVSHERLQALVDQKSREVAERQERFRGGAAPPDVRGRTVIVVDDGIATGGTMHAALRAIRRRGPARLVLAVPIASRDKLEDFQREVDDVVCVEPREVMFAVGEGYVDFEQTTDEDVIELLERSRARQLGAERAVVVETPEASLRGDLVVPIGARGIVLFAHGSGSSRKSPRNRFVAGVLQRAGLATLLFDLLTEDEEEIDEIDAHLRFDIPLLTGRLRDATDWVRAQPDTRALRIGYFGASTGAAAALDAAAGRADVFAVVSRGGRPDLAVALDRVRAPTLLLVGGDDREVIRLNRLALDQLRCKKKLEIVPGATHLFEEPGTLERVAQSAADWFGARLVTTETGLVASRPA